MALQLKVSVMNPPNTGDKDKPAYTALALMPIKVPFFIGSHCCTNTDIPVQKTIDRAIPCKIRINSNIAKVGDRGTIKVVIAVSTVPIFKIFKLPNLFAKAADGSKKEAALAVKTLITWVMFSGAVLKSLAIKGTAILIELPENALKKQFREIEIIKAKLIDII